MNITKIAKELSINKTLSLSLDGDISVSVDLVSPNEYEYEISGAGFHDIADSVSGDAESALKLILQPLVA